MRMRATLPACRIVLVPTGPQGINEDVHRFAGTQDCGRRVGRMFRRKAWEELENWYSFKRKQALLVTGARQVGKTYLIREFAASKYPNVVEINLYDNADAARAFSRATSSRELFMRISAFADAPLVPGQTVIFLDEVQECKEAVTMTKFLMERGDYDYILSGSLLGVELKSIRSAPVGYLCTVTMYPMDFEEYCWANGISDEVIAEAKAAFEEERPVDEFVDRRLKELLHRYLISGGMPDAVQAFVDTDDVTAVRTAQNAIIELYRFDISKYAGDRARIVRRIFDLIPSEVSQQNKRFVARDIDGDSHINRYENDFLWLADANAAIPVYNVDEPRYPLKASMRANSFKLFQSDVGLLTYQMGMDVVRQMLGDRPDINYGAIYENFVAQELVAHGLEPFYFKNQAMGELDFVVQWPFDRVLPIEVKSGKGYTRHSALSKVLATENYGIEQGVVLCEGNVERQGDVLYLPAYMTMMFQR